MTRTTQKIVLFAFAEQAGHVSGILKAMQTEAVIDIMVAEAIKTSEIEGEYLSRQDVVSSIRNHLGLNQAFDAIKDKRMVENNRRFV